MKLYLASLGAGLLVGIVYALLQVRSPAPPVVALVGLLGILVGEQIPPLLKAAWTRDPAAFGWLSHVRPHVFGHLPRGGGAPADHAGKTPAGKTPPGKTTAGKTTAGETHTASEGDRG